MHCPGRIVEIVIALRHLPGADGLAVPVLPAVPAGHRDRPADGVAAKCSWSGLLLDELNSQLVSGMKVPPGIHPDGLDDGFAVAVSAMPVWSLRESACWR